MTSGQLWTDRYQQVCDAILLLHLLSLWTRLVFILLFVLEHICNNLLYLHVDSEKDVKVKVVPLLIQAVCQS